ncbi:Na+/H+ antiporter NhaC [Pseudohongiella sp. SYSU M77423]|uniref:Na+/H+ antiporter NhaC n=1 Tax=Pseudohongiella sp. SYSU M77423 TaxID=3042312 RepID=UPI0024805B5A|nr:Na+/H+ antiporter NhaC [Pseudohongiella sp. SYSU M77423]MDH7943118.1 Na+/H+ antiporter NhaC [Pseudohongiella sp. SYSU M77423]
MTSQQTPPSLMVCVLPLLLLFTLLGYNVAVYGDDSLSGANQAALIAAAALAAALGLLQGTSWQRIQDFIIDNIKAATLAILILLMVGALTGSWLVSGIVPAMIYYGLEIFNPSFFIASACLLTALAAVVIGSSWSTSATLGVALMSIGHAMGINPGLVAGALISGAYFGDKMSPLSDTTNLASGVAGVDLFTHIRYLALTAFPSILLTLLIYLVVGWFAGGEAADTSNTAIYQQLISEKFTLNPLLLLVPAGVIFLIIKKVAALPALFMGVLAGLICAFVFQQPLLAELSAATGGTYQTLMQAIYGDTAIPTGNAILDDLLSTGGMAGMLYTIWLILSAMIFGGAMEASGFLARITNALISRVKSAAGLVTATGATCMVTNVSASDQYLSIVVPGRMFTQAYQQANLAPQNLSRTLEDTGTVTSVLVPWNTCGAYHAGVLGVATLSYAPWALFCLISPLMTLAFAWFRIRIVKTEPESEQMAAA